MADPYSYTYWKGRAEAAEAKLAEAERLYEEAEADNLANQADLSRLEREAGK